MTETFTPWASSLGGVLIGLGATVLLLGDSRLAGISGILGGLFQPVAGEVGWRVAFLVGLAAAGVGAALFVPEALVNTAPRAPAVLVAAGLLVGFGTRLGDGCTSGHGVCGLSRLSGRSLVSVLTFMGAGAVTVAVMRVWGGAA